jgi:hypothetical protein
MTHQFGRQAIGVNQPPGGGSLYPLVEPSADIQDLLGDFYLSYLDDACALVYPFRLAWLYGCGTEPAPLPAGMPAPTHAKDLVVLDAHDRVVFDSTSATSYREVPWGGRLLIVQWETEEEVCRLTLHTDWEPGAEVRTYSQHITPANGELDPRTLNRLPRRLRAIRVGLQTFRGPVLLEAGYNIQLAGRGTARTDGGPAIDRVDMDAVPGAGLGRQPSCLDTEVLVRRINHTAPDAAGNFFLQLDGCLRAQRALHVTDGPEGREAVYAYHDFPPADAASTVRLFNDCTPCCACSYFVRTYRGLARTWERWRQAGLLAESARDTHRNNIGRWEAERQRRLECPARLVVSSDSDCKLFVGAAYCNFSDLCIGPLELRFTFRHFTRHPARSAPVEVPARLQVADPVLEGTTTDGEQGHVPLVRLPTVSFFVDHAGPRATTTAKFRACFPGCQTGDTVEVAFSVHVPEPVGPDQPEVDVPEEVSARWDEAAIPEGEAVRAVVQRTAPLDPRRKLTACEQCAAPIVQPAGES